MEALFQTIMQLDEAYIRLFQAVLRYLLPFLTILLLFRTIRPLLTFRREPEIWGWLEETDGTRTSITHWENIIGRNRHSDIVVDAPTVSRSHAVLTRYDDGTWTIADAGSKSGTQVNGEDIDICVVSEADSITLGGVELRLVPISPKQEMRLAQLRTKASGPFASILSVVLLTLIQVLIGTSYLMTADRSYYGNIFWGFAGIAAMQWILLIFYLCIRRFSFELETIAFFLCTMGMAAIAAVKPGETLKQLIAMLLGVAAYLLVGWSVRDHDRAKKMRYVAGVAGILLLLVTLVFGKEYHGAKNWIVIGSLSLQPSELCKVCFVFIGASTMDRILQKRNLILFIAYTLVICGCLAVMNDFGTALIFFAAFLVIAYLRSGSVGTIALACTALGFAGVLAIKIAPHALRRFAIWRHIWEDPLGAGYQQTRALMCIASGGLFGLGVGNGYMKRIFAADSDVVFATLCEEWGLLMGIMLIVCVIALGIFVVRTAAVSRSSFYTIGGCTAAGILLIQAILNAMGTVDILPLTGVTFPFVSNGGSSMICAWGLLAFMKATDTRQNASFAVRLPRRGRGYDE